MGERYVECYSESDEVASGEKSDGRQVGIFTVSNSLIT